MTTDPGRLLVALGVERDGRTAEAEAAYAAILALAPEDGFALYLLGSLLVRTGRRDAAIPFLRRAVAARADHQDSRLMLGNALSDDPEAAMAVFASLPNNAGAQVNLSTLQLAAGRSGDALSAARRAVDLAPGLADAQIAVAVSCLATDDAAGALDAAGRADGHPEAAFYRGTALSRLGRAEAAKSWLQAAVASRPEHFQALLNLGGVLTVLAEFDAALAVLTRAVTVQPGRPEGWSGLGYLYEHWARPADQIAALDRAVALSPDDAVPRYNRALARIASGDWIRGFAEAECRRDAAVMRLDLPQSGPRYAGGELRGRTILLCAEQGFGDTIQFLRYARPLRECGATIVARVQAPLVGISAAMPEIAAVITPNAVQPDCDAWIEMPSLAHVFATTPDTVPAPGGYLRFAMGAGGGIGVVWAGNPAHSNDFRRSLPPDALAGLLRAIGPRAVSLQHGARGAECAAFGIAPADLADFTATAAIIAQLDLVITVDTSVAHLAGAMGKQVWLLLNNMGEWRWGVSGDTTPWYDSMRLFRQTVPGDWNGIIARVAVALRDAGLR